MGRILLRVLLGAVFLAILAGVGWYLYGGLWRDRFEARVAALRSAGHPTRFEDLATPPIPDEENGAKLLEQAARFLAEREKAPDSAERLLWKDKHTDEEIVAIATYLDSLAPYFELLAQVPGRNGWRPDVEWSKGITMMPGPVAELSSARRLLQARAQFDLEPEGRTERTAATAVLLIDLGRKCRGPFAIGHLVPMSMTAAAIEVLRRAMREPGFDPTLFRRAVDSRLAQATPDRGPPASMFIEERVYLTAVLRAIDEGNASEFSAGILESHLFPFLHRPRLHKDGCTCLDLAEEGIRRSDTTPEDALVVGADFRARYPRARLDTDNLVPNYGTLYAHVFSKHGDYVASLRLARIVMALLEYRQRESTWPANLAALGEMPTDPYSGKPFLYERTEHGCRVCAAKEDTPEQLEERKLLWALEDDQIPAMAR